MNVIPLMSIINSHATTNLLHDFMLIIELNQFVWSELKWIELRIRREYT